MSTRAVVVNMSSLSLSSKKSGCSELLSKLEELGPGGEGGEVSCNGKG